MCRLTFVLLSQALCVTQSKCFVFSLRNTKAPDHMAVVSKDGTVFWKRKVEADVSCSMDVTRFPHDEQNCFLKVNHLRIEGTAQDRRPFCIFHNIIISQKDASTSLIFHNLNEIWQSLELMDTFIIGNNCQPFRKITKLNIVNILKKY